MKTNLDTLKSEILEHLESEDFTIFFGHSRVMDSEPLVFWDTERHSDYKLFVKTAKSAGAKLMVFHEREFHGDVIDNAIEQLQGSDLPTEDQRTIERRLKELRVYEGFTCSIELSFDYETHVYLFEVQTEWYEELTNLLDDLEFLDSGDDDEDGEDAISGYFSKN